MTYELKRPEIVEPCPKCGKKDMIRLEDMFEIKYAVYCDRCHVRTIWELTPEQAVATWNRRDDGGISNRR